MSRDTKWILAIVIGVALLISSVSWSITYYCTYGFPKRKAPDRVRLMKPIQCRIGTPRTVPVEKSDKTTARECPTCGPICYCNGDIDDCLIPDLMRESISTNQGQ